MIENILFDLDGTLTDPKAGICRCIQFSLEHLSVEIPSADELTWCIGPPLRDSFSKLLDTTDAPILDRALALYRKRFTEKGMFENFVYPEVPAALNALKAGRVKLFLATSKPRIFAEKILEHFKLAPFFNRIYGAQLDGSLVDKGELIAHIIKAEKLDPGLTLMVGDRCYDIAGGKKNGVVTAAVTYGYAGPNEIESSDPDLIFDRLTDLSARFPLSLSQGPDPSPEART